MQPQQLPVAGQIFDQTGRLIKQFFITQEQTELITTDLESGVYILIINNSSQRVVIK